MLSRKIIAADCERIVGNTKYAVSGEFSECFMIERVVG
jgi:hypothetical protein